MPVSLIDLLQHLDEHLEPSRFSDYCPNGLQVEGGETISRLVTGVTASQALIDRAVEWGADALLVHHGYFWKGEAPEVVGIKRRRLAALLAANVSLLAYHLPLDAHPVLGNNAGFGRAIGLATLEALEPDVAEGLGCIGSLPNAITAHELIALLAQETGREPLHIDGGGGNTIQRVAWCTGAAQGYIGAAVTAGADAYITGEVSEQTVHIAREEGIHFFARLNVSWIVYCKTKRPMKMRS